MSTSDSLNSREMGGGEDQQLSSELEILMPIVVKILLAFEFPTEINALLRRATLTFVSDRRSAVESA